jgi:hypothetical protein
MRHVALATPPERPVDYLDFVRQKIIVLPLLGPTIAAGDIHPWLKPHCRDIVTWAVNGGRRAIFAAFGLHKTIMQIEALRQIRAQEGGIQIIIAPLNVILEGTFEGDAAQIGVETLFVRTTAEIVAAIHRGFVGQYLAHYEAIRDGKIDVALLVAAHGLNGISLDEADCLRGLGGTKTFREFMKLFPGMRYKFVATATPSPNEYVELLAYAAFLEVMDVGQAKTRFFKRNSEEADDLTIHPHKVEEFWMWVNSWAAFVQRPSDLGHSDEGYALPPMVVHWHEVASDHREAGADKGGQGLLLKRDAIGIVEASREKRDSVDARVAKMLELRAEDPGAHRLIWHDLERERLAIEKAVPGILTVCGGTDHEARIKAFQRFKTGAAQELATKPVIAGAGGNFQKHCAWEIFLGIGFKFRDFIQAIHRVQRFGQEREVRIDLIFTESERAVRAELERKWRDHDATAARMSEIIRRFGLGLEGASGVLERSIEIEPTRETEASTLGGADPDWQVWRGDTVLHARTMRSDSVGLIVTSVPFGTQYEYSPSYNDFGHTDDLDHFFAQMDFLTPELLRVLEPGRRLEVHVKDRVVPSGLTGRGYRTIQPFHSRCIEHYTAHGFAYLGMTTIVTDVVRENAGTYRLGWTEQCKDSSGMGCGLPEYLLHFRKDPSDRTNGYADRPVRKDKPMVEVLDTGDVIPWDNALVKDMQARPVPGTGYSRSRWQTDAAGYWRSCGDRVLMAEDLIGLKWDKLFQLVRGWSYATLYDHEGHVALMEAMETRWSLPTDFALMPVQSGHPEVWTDVARMLGANTLQSAKGREQHLCPLPFDIVDRAIKAWSEPGDLVFDPFGGLMTVPLRAVKHGRRGAGVELNPGYYADGVRLLREQDAGRGTASLFDLMGMNDPAPGGLEGEAA